MSRESNHNLPFGALTHVVPVEYNVCIEYHPRLFLNRDLLPGYLETAMGEARVILMPKPDKRIKRKTKAKTKDKYVL